MVGRRFRRAPRHGESSVAPIEVPEATAASPQFRPRRLDRIHDAPDAFLSMDESLSVNKLLRAFSRMAVTAGCLSLPRRAMA